MDIKKISNFENLVQPEKGIGAKGSQALGPSFQETLSGLQNGVQTGSDIVAPQIGRNTAMARPSLEPVKFSNHAVERMQTRGISFNKADIERLNEAVGRAAAKGSKDTLVLMNDSALIVSVKNKTVVTVMDKAALKDNVFTNIDSTIVM